MPLSPVAKNNRDSKTPRNSRGSKVTKNNGNSDFPEEDLGSGVYRMHGYFRRNLNDIVILVILSGLTIVNFFGEPKLSSLNFFYIVILITGYSLGKRFAVLSAFLTILIVWTFILADNSPYLAHNTREELNFHMTIWGGLLILTGWLGSALAKIFHKETSSDLFISPTADPRESVDKSSKR